MSNLVSFESYVDSTMQVFFDQLDKRFVAKGEVCDLGTWLQWFAFDVMGEITFSKRFGFLESARDVDGIAENIWQYFRKTSPVRSLLIAKLLGLWRRMLMRCLQITQMAWLDWVWTKNPLLQQLRLVKANPIVNFANAQNNERKSLNHKLEEETVAKLNSRDFLSRFLEVLDKDPKIPRW